MKFYSLIPLAFLVACASQRSGHAPANKAKDDVPKKRIAIKKYDTPQVSVEVKDNKGKVVSRIEEQDMTIYKLRIKNYEDKSIDELEEILKTSNAQVTTVIIEALFHRAMDNYNAAMIKKREEGLEDSLPVNIDHVVRIYASLLKDKREVVLEDDDTTLWMESKSIYEMPQIRIYAAYMAQRITNGEIKPYSFEFKKHRSGILYCVKNDFAQVKEDVAANWLKWWEEYGKEQYSK